MKSDSKGDNKKNKKGGRSTWPVVYRLAATGALVAYTAVGSKTVVPAYAQQPPARTEAGGAADPARSLEVRRFDIPAGSLESAIAAFRDVTGFEVVISDALIGTLRSPGVSGLYTPEQALAVLLQGTEVGYRMAAPAKVQLEPKGPTTTVEVRARIEPSSPKYTEPLRDTPQTITVIPEAVIEQQGATTLREVLRNVPGLTVVAGEGGAPAGDNLTLRGFSARNDIFIDGARDLGAQSRDPFNLEQVEVVKGPQSAFTGRGSSGGSINLVSKTPNLSPHFDVGGSLGTDPLRRATVDLNTPIRPLGERTALRLNLLAHDSAVAGRDVVENDRWGVAPSLTFGLGTPTRLTLGYYKLKQENLSDYGIPWVPANNNALAEFRDQPAPVPRDTFYGFRDRDREYMGADAATARFEHDFTDGLRFRNQFRYSRTTRDSMATPPRFADPDSTIIRREMRSWITEDEIWDNQADLTANFSTGSVRHSVATGFAASHENSLRRLRSAPDQPTTLLNPNPDDVYTGEITINPQAGDLTGDSLAIYAFDTIQLGRRWQVTGGLRGERFDVQGVSTSGEPLENVSNMLSLRAGVVYKPASDGSLYASYGSSLSPSLEGLSYTGGNDDPTLDPEKTYTIELGSKWDLFGDRLLVTGALFQVEKTNARTPGVLPGDPPQVLDGKQRVRGIEFGATGNITRSWQLFAGYTLMDGEIVESNNPSEIGNQFPQTPDNSLNLWTTYSLPWRITLGGGARYVGRRYNNTSNTRSVEGYWTADAMASVPVSSHLDLRLNLYNMTNEYYFDRVGGGHVVPGPGRSLMASVHLRF